MSDRLFEVFRTKKSVLTKGRTGTNPVSDHRRDSESVAAGRKEARATVIGYRTTYTEVSKPYQFEVSLEHRDDAGCIIGISAGDAGIEWPEPLLGWLISSLSQIKAARSDSEDTQLEAATHKLVDRQQPLGQEFERVWDESSDKLYDWDTQQAEGRPDDEAMVALRLMWAAFQYPSRDKRLADAARAAARSVLFGDSEDTQQAEGAANPSNQLQELIEAAEAAHGFCVLIEKFRDEGDQQAATAIRKRLCTALQNVKKSDK